MSGIPQSYTGNGAASEVDQSPLPLSYTADATTAIYAPPMSLASPSAETTPLQATPTASAPTTYLGLSGGDATPEIQQHQSIETYDSGATVGGGDLAASVIAVGVNDGNGVEMGKRKRGRPKKIMTEGMEGGVAVMAVASDGGGTRETGKFSGKRGRGRPKGSVNRKHHEQFSFNVITQAVSGPAGVGFTPNIIAVKTGEDVLTKLMLFSQYNTQAVCILSATGAISNVMLRQASSSGGTVNYEGRFEILSLSGSFLLMESGGQRSRTGGLSVSLAGPDGRVLGGGVAGVLIAASPVQVIVGTFNVASQQPTKSGHNEVHTAQPKFISGVSMGGIPPSRANLSESSGGPGIPLNYSAGGCNNSNSQTIQNVTWR